MTYPKLARRKANNSEVYKKIRKIDTEEAEEHIIQIGQAVEDAAKEYLQNKYNTEVVDLMPRYQKIHTNEESDDEDDDDEVFIRVSNDLPTILQNTIAAIKEQKRILYQPTFQVGDCLVRADFMVKN
ncbi:MAG: hypothetical protein WCJ81_01175 [bacterium]